MFGISAHNISLCVAILSLHFSVECILDVHNVLVLMTRSGSRDAKKAFEYSHVMQGKCPDTHKKGTYLESH